MKKFSQLALPYIIWSIIILLLPVLLIAFYAVTDSGNTVVNLVLLYKILLSFLPIMISYLFYGDRFQLHLKQQLFVFC